MKLLLVILSVVAVTLSDYILRDSIDLEPEFKELLNQPGKRPEQAYARSQHGKLTGECAGETCTVDMETEDDMILEKYWSKSYKMESSDARLDGRTVLFEVQAAEMKFEGSYMYSQPDLSLMHLFAIEGSENDEVWKECNSNSMTGFLKDGSQAKTLPNAWKKHQLKTLNSLGDKLQCGEWRSMSMELCQSYATHPNFNKQIMFFDVSEQPYYFIRMCITIVDTQCVEGTARDLAGLELQTADGEINIRIDHMVSTATVPIKYFAVNTHDLKPVGLYHAPSVPNLGSTPKSGIGSFQTSRAISTDETQYYYGNENIFEWNVREKGKGLKRIAADGYQADGFYSWGETGIDNTHYEVGTQPKLIEWLILGIVVGVAAVIAGLAIAASTKVCVVDRSNVNDEYNMLIRDVMLALDKKYPEYTPSLTKAPVVQESGKPTPPEVTLSTIRCGVARMKLRAKGVKLIQNPDDIELITVSSPYAQVSLSGSGSYVEIDLQHKGGPGVVPLRGYDENMRLFQYQLTLPVGTDEPIKFKVGFGAKGKETYTVGVCVNRMCVRTKKVEEVETPDGHGDQDIDGHGDSNSASANDGNFFSSILGWLSYIFKDWGFGFFNVFLWVVIALSIYLSFTFLRTLCANYRYNKTAGMMIAILMLMTLVGAQDIPQGSFVGDQVRTGKLKGAKVGKAQGSGLVEQQQQQPAVPVQQQQQQQQAAEPNAAVPVKGKPNKQGKVDNAALIQQHNAEGHPNNIPEKLDSFSHLVEDPTDGYFDSMLSVGSTCSWAKYTRDEVTSFVATEEVACTADCTTMPGKGTRCWDLSSSTLRSGTVKCASDDCVSAQGMVGSKETGAWGYLDCEGAVKHNRYGATRKNEQISVNILEYLPNKTMVATQKIAAVVLVVGSTTDFGDYVKKAIVDDLSDDTLVVESHCKTVCGVAVNYMSKCFAWIETTRSSTLKSKYIGKRWKVKMMKQNSGRKHRKLKLPLSSTDLGMLSDGVNSWPIALGGPIVLDTDDVLGGTTDTSVSEVFAKTSDGSVFGSIKYAHMNISTKIIQMAIGNNPVIHMGFGASQPLNYQVPNCGGELAMIRGKLTCSGECCLISTNSWAGHTVLENGQEVPMSKDSVVSYWKGGMTHSYTSKETHNCVPKQWGDRWWCYKEDYPEAWWTQVGLLIIFPTLLAFLVIMKLIWGTWRNPFAAVKRLADKATTRISNKIVPKNKTLGEQMELIKIPRAKPRHPLRPNRLGDKYD